MSVVSQSGLRQADLSSNGDSLNSIPEQLQYQTYGQLTKCVCVCALDSRLVYSLLMVDLVVYRFQGPLRQPLYWSPTNVGCCLIFDLSEAVVLPQTVQ